MSSLPWPLWASTDGPEGGQVLALDGHDAGHHHFGLLVLEQAQG